MMKRDISFMGHAGEDRHFILRVSEGATEIKISLSEEEAKEIFEQMGCWKKEWEETK